MRTAWAASAASLPLIPTIVPPTDGAMSYWLQAQVLAMGSDWPNPNSPHLAPLPQPQVVTRAQANQQIVFPWQRPAWEEAENVSKTRMNSKTCLTVGGKGVCPLPERRTCQPEGWHSAAILPPRAFIKLCLKPGLAPYFWDLWTNKFPLSYYLSLVVVFLWPRLNTLQLIQNPLAGSGEM